MHFGLSVTDYIHLRKIQEAKSLILFSNKTMTDIAYELSYNESTYFSKVFKKYEGITIQKFKAHEQYDS